MKNLSLVIDSLQNQNIQVDYSQKALDRHTRDSSQLHLPPLCVAIPTDNRETAAIVKECHNHAVPLTAAGGYTGLSGGALGYQSVRLYMRNMDCFSIENDCIRAQAGASIPEIIRACDQAGFVFPCQPASACRAEDTYEYLGTTVGPVTLGGSLGANASGLVGCKLGAILDWVEELTIVEPDGTLQTITDNFKRFVGTEGRYGIICEAVIRLSPIPTDICTWVVGGSGIPLFSDAANAIGNAGRLPLLAEGMIMGETPPDFPTLARRYMDNADAFLESFGSLFNPHSWLILLQGSHEETEACRKAIIASAPEAEVTPLNSEDYGLIRKLRAAASDEIGRGPGPETAAADPRPPLERAAAFLAESIEQFTKRGILPKGEHNLGMLRMFLSDEIQRNAYTAAITNGTAIDDGSSLLWEQCNGDLKAFFFNHLKPVINQQMIDEQIAINFPGNEDILVPVNKLQDVIHLLAELMQKYGARPVPLYYCHINFRKQPGWLLIHNRLLLDINEFV